MKMIYPIDKVYITQYFGERPAVYAQFGMAGHNGVDFRTRFTDSPMGRRYTVAVLPGKVTEEGYQPTGYGHFVRLEHEGGTQTIYGHHTKNYVKVGDVVEQGQRIGLTGNTGFSSGPHLHFGYRPLGWKKNYNNGFKGYVDPLPFLEGQEIPEPGKVYDMAFTKKWAGWMIVVPEMNGQAYYVNPKLLKKFPISTIKPSEGAKLAQEGGWIGMTREDVDRIPDA